MISLVEVYGDKLYNRKEAYKKSKYIPYISAFIWDIVVAIVAVKIFEINWDYAIIKVYGILFIYSLAKPIMTWPLDKLNYKMFLKDALILEMRHYLRVFNITLSEDNMCTYDDYLLSASFNNTLEDKEKVLAAITYAGVVHQMATNPRMDSVYYNAWSDTISEYIKDNPGKALSLDMD